MLSVRVSVYSRQVCSFRKPAFSALHILLKSSNDVILSDGYSTRFIKDFLVVEYCVCIKVLWNTIKLSIYCVSFYQRSRKFSFTFQVRFLFSASVKSSRIPASAYSSTQKNVRMMMSGALRLLQMPQLCPVLRPCSKLIVTCTFRCSLL